MTPASRRVTTLHKAGAVQAQEPLAVSPVSVLKNIRRPISKGVLDLHRPPTVAGRPPRALRWKTNDPMADWREPVTVAQLLRWDPRANVARYTLASTKAAREIGALLAIGLGPIVIHTRNERTGPSASNWSSTRLTPRPTTDPTAPRSSTDNRQATSGSFRTNVGRDTCRRRCMPCTGRTAVAAGQPLRPLRRHKGVPPSRRRPPCGVRPPAPPAPEPDGVPALLPPSRPPPPCAPSRPPPAPGPPPPRRTAASRGGRSRRPPHPSRWVGCTASAPVGTRASTGSSST